MINNTKFKSKIKLFKIFFKSKRQTEVKNKVESNEKVEWEVKKKKKLKVNKIIIIEVKL